MQAIFNLPNLVPISDQTHRVWVSECRIVARHGCWCECCLFSKSTWSIILSYLSVLWWSMNKRSVKLVPCYNINFVPVKVVKWTWRGLIWRIKVWRVPPPQRACSWACWFIVCYRLAKKKKKKYMKDLNSLKQYFKKQMMKMEPK